MSEKALRSKVIRLAHSKPELRDHLLPLVKQAGFGNASKYSLDGATEVWWLTLAEMLHFGGVEVLIKDTNSQSITFSAFGVNGVPARLYAERGVIYADIEGTPAIGHKSVKKAKVGSTSKSSHEDVAKAIKALL